MYSSSSIFFSFRLFTTKIPTSLFFPHRTPPNPHPLPFSRRISFERMAAATNNPPLSVSASASSPASLPSVEDGLPPKLLEIVRLFQSVQEPRAKYEQLLFYGKNLKSLDEVYKTRKNKVEGCVSQVWVRAYLDSERNVVFEADSDSVLTKGLAALLVNGLSGRPAEEVVRISPEFVVLLGLQQSLTPSRNNGFLNMLKLMQRKALELLVEAEKGSDSSNLEAKSGDKVKSSGFGEKFNGLEGRAVTEKSARSEIGVSSEVKSGDKLESAGFGEKFDGLEAETSGRSGKESNSGSGSGSGSGLLGRRGMRIKEKLEKELSPVELEVEDISYQHAGHAGVRGNEDGETHFNVKIVSKEFEGKSLVKRHRLVYGLLQEELQSGLHALSIVAKTASEVAGQ